MTSVCFERGVEIAAPSERVRDELSDPRRFLGLQPFLVEIEEQPPAGGARTFAATERVPLLGPLAIPSRLRVELRPDAARGRVAFATRAPLGVRLRGAFALSEVAGRTRVVESVELACPRWLRGFVVRRAIRAQETLLANLKQRLEAGPR